VSHLKFSFIRVFSWNYKCRPQTRTTEFWRTLGKTGRSHKGRAVWAKFSFDHWTAIVTYVTYIDTYMYVVYASARTCASEMRGVRIALKGAEDVPLLLFESIIAMLAGRRRANGRYISRLAFMWRPTVELIFTRFGADPLLLSSSSVPYPRSEHASTMSRNSRFRLLFSRLWSRLPRRNNFLAHIFSREI